MKTIELEQRSPEWHAFRNTRIGASDVSVIIGISTFDSVSDLWYRKKGLMPEKQINKAMQDGIDFEDKARDLLEGYHGVIYSPAVVVSEENERLFASLDALSWCNTKIAELKVSDKLYEKLKFEGHIPLYYISQMQWQMKVSGFFTCSYAVYSKTHDEIAQKEVPYDPEYFNREKMDKILSFLESLDGDVPPEDPGKDFSVVDVDAYQFSTIQQYLNVCEEEKILFDKKEFLRKQILNWTDDGNMVFSFHQNNILRAERVERKSAVDWKKVCVEYKIKEEDLQRFRKDQIGYYKLTSCKE